MSNLHPAVKFMIFFLILAVAGTEMMAGGHLDLGVILGSALSAAFITWVTRNEGRE